jgi:lysophospholipase L1-like esterase
MAALRAASSLTTSASETKTILCFGDSNTWGADAQTGLRFGRNTRWPARLRARLADRADVIEQGLNGRTFATDDPTCNWLAPNFDPAVTNGRKALMPVLHSVKPCDLLVLALGVNDLKGRFALSPAEIANHAGLLIDDVVLSGISAERHSTGPSLHADYSAGAAGAPTGGEGDVPAILLVCPPPITNETFFPDFAAGGIARSKALRGEFERVAEAKRAMWGARGLHLGLLLTGDVAGIECDPLDGIHLTAEAHAALAKEVGDKAESMLGL